MNSRLSRQTGQRIRAEGGFTLLELLVAITVLSLVALVMLGGLKFGASVWEREQASSDRSDAIATTENLLRGEFSAIYPEWQNVPPDPARVAFDGEPQSLGFEAPPPAQFGPGTNLLYSLERSAKGSLDIVWQSADGGVPARAPLLRDIAAIELAYYGPQFGGTAAKWSDRWSNRARLPDLIRLRVTFPAGDRRVWPELIVHPDITVDVRCIYEPLTRTCRGRPE